MLYVNFINRIILGFQERECYTWRKLAWIIWNLPVKSSRNDTLEEKIRSSSAELKKRKIKLKLISMVIKELQIVTI